MEQVEVASLAEWDAWLAKHHEKHATIWLVLPKKVGKQHTFPFVEVVKTALCYGWVDSVPGKVDDLRYKVRFSPRNPKSNWSAVNKEFVAELRADGRMKPAGEALVTYAKANGQWDALNDVDALVVQPDLAEAFAKTPGSKAQWDAFPRSVKRGQLEQIYTAKRAETRAKRIRLVVENAAEGRRAFFER